MRLIMMLVLFVLPPIFAQVSDDMTPVDTVEKTFKGMAKRDAAMIRSTMLSNARLYSVRADGTTAGSALEDFIRQIDSSNGDVLERFTSQPNVSIRGRLAQVWGEYEFLRDGKFHHCGVDSVSLFRTAEGWKIATIVYTVEMTGCKGQ